ncbi:MAG: hypothetical protein K5Q68_15100 [Roseococcus sp.]|nr:hypothetical protein [Roseococcus sp.]
MDRISGATVDIGSGRRGFRGRNLLLSQAGTIPDPNWFNGVQEEIIRAIETLGLTPLDANREQLVQAMRRLAGGNVRTISTGGVTLTADDAGLVLVNASGSFGITLPAANSAGGRPLRLTLVRVDADPGTTTIARAGSDTIDGLTTLPLTAGQRVTLISDGASGWRFAAQLALGGIQSFFSSGTFTVPSGVQRVRARVWGAGSGGGVYATGAPSAGGSGGGYAEGIYAVTPGAAITVTVGAGGVANSNGGSSSFGAFCSATGGQTGATNTTTGAPGTGTGGQINLTGGGGGLGIQLAGAALDRAGGTGGGAPFGQQSGNPWVGGSSVAGSFPGGGASGQAAAGSTASGANGLVIVEW